MSAVAAARDPLVVAARVALAVCGALCLLFAVWVSAGFPGIDATEAEDAEAALGRVLVALVVLSVALVNLGAMWGLARGKRWAWIGSVVLGGLYSISCCFPIGVLLLIALLRAPVREPYLGAPQQAPMR